MASGSYTPLSDEQRGFLEGDSTGSLGSTRGRISAGGLCDLEDKGIIELMITPMGGDYVFTDAGEVCAEALRK